MAILYGTQSNGETLPVLVDQFGNLLAKGIDGEPGQPGQPGTPGQPGGEGPPGQPGTPGEGVPSPYGPDGSYLQIVDGAPAWTDSPGPGPEPGPTSDVVCTNLWSDYQLYSAQDTPVDPPDPTTYLKELSTWGNPNAKSWAGASFTGPSGTGDISHSDRFELTNSFSKVFVVSYERTFVSEQSVNYPAITPSIDTEYATLITNTFELTDGDPKGLKWGGGTVGWLLNREMSVVNVTTTYSRQYMQEQQIFIRYFALEDPGVFALRRQARVEEQVRRLRVMTTDIDLSRPTQD